MKDFLARWMPIDASTHGGALDSMNAWVHWLMAILFVGWSVYFVYVLLKFRAAKNPKANYEGTKSHFGTWVEGAVVVVEAILLIGFAIPAWARWVAPYPADSEALVVRVVGEQFAWNIHYPGPDGVFGNRDPYLVAGGTNPLGLDPKDPASHDDVVSVNQLHLPVDRPIMVLLSTKDVIHSFFLPVMRVKQDAIPGEEIPVRFTAKTASPADAVFPACAATKSCWEIACTQLCGLGHYRMRGFLSVHEEGGFETWLAEQDPFVAPAAPPAPALEPAPAPEAEPSVEPAA